MKSGVQKSAKYISGGKSGKSLHHHSSSGLRGGDISSDYYNFLIFFSYAASFNFV
jgi:hypothetical protein